MRTLRTLLFVLPLAGLAATQSGCLLAVAAVGTGATVAYVRGDLDTSLDADPKTVAVATEAAMKQMDVAIISHEATGLDAKIVGRTARDTKLEVSVKGEGEHTSKVSIRAGVFGDDALQTALLAKIKANLGKSSPAPDKEKTETAETTDPRD
jgi:hypothetical protein